MKPQNSEIINQSFAQQAENFEAPQLAFTKADFIDYTLKTVSPDPNDNFLEVAAGTCMCGRSFAPFVRSVVCIDATEEMLAVGKRAAAQEPFRKTEDEIERLRDPSHVKNLSKEEMQGLFSSGKSVIQICETTRIRQHLNDWLSLTHTPEDIRSEITARMQADINGDKKTGSDPYILDGEICFDQKWVLTVGRFS